MHNLDQTTGKTAFAFNSEGGQPWHKLGKSVVGAMTVAEALEKGGANFIADKAPVFTDIMTLNEDGMPVTKRIEDPDHFMVYRNDTFASLGIVGRRYEIVQMSAALDFFDAALGQGVAAIDTVGMLNKGRTGFLLAKMNDPIEVKPGDVTERFLLFTNSFDGSSPVRCLFTSVRVVCQNTLTAALYGKKGSACVNIRHTKNAHTKIEQAHMVLNASQEYWNHQRQVFTAMANKQLSTSAVDQFLADLFPAKDESNVPTRTENRRKQVLKAFEGENSEGGEAVGQDDFNAWGLFNAVTYVIDHESTLRDGTDRWEQSAFGNGAKTRQKAYDLLTSAL